jgi:hypothetical protein
MISDDITRILKVESLDFSDFAGGGGWFMSDSDVSLSKRFLVRGFW